MDLDLRLLAFAERPARDNRQAIPLHVYIINESPATLRILNELDSINVPQSPPDDGEAIADADLTHIDFGVSGSATFNEVPEGECLRVTLLLREEQLALLEHAKQMKTAVKVRAGGDEEGEATTLLLPAPVYLVNS